MKTPLVSHTPTNVKLKWFQGDSEKSFIENWLKDPSLMRRFGWSPEVEIEYCMDAYGFRNQHNHIDGSFLALGCSFTFGTGLRQEQTWPCILGRQTNNSVFNAGVPGGSMDSAFRILNAILAEHHPKAVFCLAPLDNRWEFHFRDEYVNYGPWPWYPGTKKERQKIEHDGWLRLATELHMDEERCRLNQLKNRLAMQHLCESRKIPFICLERADYHNYPRFKDDSARDVGHQGVQWQTHVSNHMQSIFQIN